LRQRLGSQDQQALRNCVTQFIADAVGAVNLIRDLSVGHHASSSSGGPPHLSAVCWQTSAISVRTSSTARSMLARSI